MISNRFYHTHPVVFHAQGKPEYSPLWPKIQEIANKVRTTIPPNLSVITFNNGQSFLNKVPGCFERSIQHQCVVLGRDVVGWRNVMKLTLIVEFLKICPNPYVLAADSSDVVATNLDHIVDKFLRKDCDILFNAESLGWPNSTLWEQERFKKPFCYLNAGVWMAHRDTALQFFAECLATAGEERSEQACIKPVFQRWARATIDDTCEIFQTLNRVDLAVLKISATLL